jgi:hypothetical protein
VIITTVARTLFLPWCSFSTLVSIASLPWWCLWHLWLAAQETSHWWCCRTWCLWPASALRTGHGLLFPLFFSPTGISVPNKYIPTVWLEHAVVQLHAWSFKPSFVWFSSLPMQVHRMQEMSFGQAPQIRRWSAYWRVQAPSLLPHAAAPNTKYYFNLFFIIFFN